FARARAEYDGITAANATDSFARAARLNRANLDVESGAIDHALAEYGALLGLDLGDTAVRHSRALLELRLGQAALPENHLTALRAAAEGLARRAAGRDLAAYRSGLTRAVILAALGEHDAAVAAASRALDLSPFATEAYLIRARILAFGGDRERSLSDVNRGLAIQSDEPRL